MMVTETGGGVKKCGRPNCATSTNSKWALTDVKTPLRMLAKPIISIRTASIHFAPSPGNGGSAISATFENPAWEIIPIT